jgi:hypothetical protein
MKSIKLVLLSVTFAVPMVMFAACGGDDSTTKPVNTPDTSVVPDTSPTGDTYVPGTDAGPDSSYNPCSNGVVFDNSRVPGYPNPPQP